MTATERRSRIGALAFLVFLQFFYAWAWSTSDVLRPAFRAALSLSLFQVGAGYSAQVVGALVGGLMIVRFEHLIGRRHTIALVTIGIGISLLAGIGVASWRGFLVQRFMLGLFAGAVFPLTIGLIAELFASHFRGRLASLIDGTYFVAVIVLGLSSGHFGLGGWKTLLWIGSVPLLLFALAAYRLVPEYPAHTDFAHPSPESKGSLGGLFKAEHRARTLAMAAMMGINACGAQAFSGWVTTYLYDVARLSGPQVGAIVACQFAGSAAGSVGWGWIVDRFGRRSGAIGLLAAAVASAGFVLAPPLPPLLAALAVLYGIAFSAVVSIGPWLAELYPRHLRTAATSMFQWGRFMSLVAPLATGGIAAHWGLATAMGSSVVAFAIAAALWNSLPETLERGHVLKRSRL